MSIPHAGYSIPEFRALHGYGERAFKALQKAGLAPHVTLMPGTQFSRITADDYAAWLKLISDPECQLTEWQRRRKRYEAIGHAAARSPGHPAQIWATFQKLKLTKNPPTPKPVPGRPRGRPARKQVEAAE